MDDITVDLGEIPLDMAQSILIAVHTALLRGVLRRGHYANLSAVQAMLTYRIAKAEQTATWSEPG